MSVVSLDSLEAEALRVRRAAQALAAAATPKVADDAVCFDRLMLSARTAYEELQRFYRSVNRGHVQ